MSKAKKKSKKSRSRTGIELQDAAEKNLPLNQTELAAVLSVCSKTVQKFTRNGMPCLYLGKVRGGKGSRPVYRYQDCMEWIKKINSLTE